MPSLNIATDNSHHITSNINTYDNQPKKLISASVSVGTVSSDGYPLSQGTDCHMGSWPVITRLTPNINLAEVAGYMRRLQAAIHNDGKPIEVDNLDVIHEIKDLCDQVYYWGIMESRFPNIQYSALCECEVIQTLIPLLSHDRSALIEAALLVFSSVLKHPISAKLFTYQNGFQHLYKSLTKYPNKEELLVLAIQVSREAAQGDIEAFLSCECISGVISAMKRFPQHVDIQKLGCLFFADLVSRPRPDPQSVPIAVLFAQIGEITAFMLKAYMAQHINSMVVDAVSHYCFTVSSYGVNVPKLLTHKDFLIICQEIGSNSLSTEKAVLNALTALSSTIPYLTIGGKRYFAIYLRDNLMRNSTISVLTCLVSVLHVLFLSTVDNNKNNNDVNNDINEKEINEEKTRRVQFDANGHNEVKEFNTAPKTFNEQVDEDFCLFLSVNQVPRIIAIALEHFGTDTEAIAIEEREGLISDEDIVSKKDNKAVKYMSDDASLHDNTLCDKSSSSSLHIQDMKEDNKHNTFKIGENGALSQNASNPTLGHISVTNGANSFTSVAMSALSDMARLSSNRWIR